MKWYRWSGIALVAIAVMVLAVPAMSLERINGWSLLFMASASGGAMVLLRRYAGARWIAASIPFWAMNDAAGWIEFLAVGLVILGFALGAVGPTLPGRRRRTAGSPLPHLSSGALVPVAPREFPNAQASRVLGVASMVFAGLAVVLALWGGDTATSVGLAIGSAIIAATFLFANWFAGRVRLRVDAVGVHGRALFVEHTIPWTEVVGLSLRYVFLPGVGGRIVYYCVQSPVRECAFPSSMAGARELQSAIESATGLRWPVPQVTPTL